MPRCRALYLVCGKVLSRTGFKEFEIRVTLRPTLNSFNFPLQATLLICHFARLSGLSARFIAVQLNNLSFQLSSANGSPSGIFLLKRLKVILFRFDFHSLKKQAN
jgi:hypothetical protein